MARPLLTVAALNPQTGKARGGAQLFVYLTGTTTLAALFEFDDVTPRANPHVLDGTGRSSFRVARGLYDIQIAGLGFTTYMEREIPAGGFVEFNDGGGDPAEVVDGAGGDGTSSYAARADHVHPFDRSLLFNDAEGDPVDVDGSPAGPGTSDYAARRDHKHAAADVGGGGVASLKNVSAGTVTPGDVVVLDQANDTAFSTTTEAASARRVGVVVEDPIAVGDFGAIMLVGRTVVAVQGAVVRGHYLVTDSTAKCAKDSGVADGEPRPAGAFAVAVTAAAGPGAGTVEAVLEGVTGDRRTRSMPLYVTVTPDNSGSGNNFGVPARRSSTAPQTTDAPKVTSQTWLLGPGDHVMCEGNLPDDYASGGRVRIQWSMVTATAGNVRPKAGIAIGVSLATDMRAQAYNDPISTVADTAVPGSLGQFAETVLTLTMTNAGPNRPFNLFIGRKAATAAEAAGDWVIERLLLEYTSKGS